MDKKYLQGYVNLQDPEGMDGHLYEVVSPSSKIRWLFADETVDGNVQYWTFDEDRKLVDGGEIEMGDHSTTEDILENIRQTAEIPDDADFELEEDSLCIDDLSGDFSGF